MKAIYIFVFILSIQTAFAQSTNPDKVYQLIKSYKEVEDSIASKINPQNTIIYKTCEGHAAFYLIQENAHWTGYFIKNLQSYIPRPPIYDTLENGDIIEYKEYQTELTKFNADSIIKKLIQNQIDDIHQLSEKAIQAHLNKLAKKKHDEFYQAIPNASHDCNGTIIIYGQKNVTATFRGVLIDTENLQTIPTIRIFYETQQILINSVKNYYQSTIINTYPSLLGNQKP